MGRSGIAVRDMYSAQVQRETETQVLDKFVVPKLRSQDCSYTPGLVGLS